VWFGPPRCLTTASSCPWIGHPVSGLLHVTPLRPVKTRFPCGSGAVYTLTSPRIATRRPVLQKVRGRTLIVLPLLVNTGFQVLFHSPPGVLFTFPSRYSFAIGHQVVFSLGGWSPLLPTGFLVSRGTPDPRPRLTDFAYGTLTPFGRPFQTSSAIRRAIYAGPLPPIPEGTGFGLFPFRSPLLRKSMFLSLPPATKMFQFAGFPPHSLCIQLWVTALSRRRVSPFGHPCFNACLRLRMAFRSLPRPSSAPGAKASTLCSYQLDLSSVFLSLDSQRIFLRMLHSLPLRDSSALTLCFSSLSLYFFSLCGFQGAFSPPPSGGVLRSTS